MRKVRDNFSIILLTLASIYVVFILINAVWAASLLEAINLSSVPMFVTIFISILLEAFPFILIGVIISSIIQVFVSEEFVARVIPKNGFKGIVLGTVLGFFFPVCDCSVIPVTRRLIKKGVPVYIAVTFMLCAPIVNPVVLLATYYAFASSMPDMIIYRSLLGIAVAIIIAVLLHTWVKSTEVLKQVHSHEHQCGCGHCHHDTPNRLQEVLGHIEQEFFDVGKYLIIGAFIASISQVFVPREVLLNAGQNEVMSISVMMIFAYVISLCSTADSFIARTFVSQFTSNSILAFLILGPMLDIKNTVMLLGNFKTKFVLKLILLIFTVVFIGVYLVDKITAL